MEQTTLCELSLRNKLYHFHIFLCYYTHKLVNLLRTLKNSRVKEHQITWPTRAQIPNQVGIMAEWQNNDVTMTCLAEMSWRFLKPRKSNYTLQPLKLAA